MNDCPWEKIEDFRSRGEFDSLVGWLNSQIQAGSARKHNIMRPYLDADSFEEAWFEHIDSGKIWRLVWPDYPFTGIFAPVE
jgi:hypothetical protein